MRGRLLEEISIAIARESRSSSIRCPLPRARGRAFYVITAIDLGALTHRKKSEGIYITCVLRHSAPPCFPVSKRAFPRGNDSEIIITRLECVTTISEIERATRLSVSSYSLLRFALKARTIARQRPTPAHLLTETEQRGSSGLFLRARRSRVDTRRYALIRAYARAN